MNSRIDLVDASGRLGGGSNGGAREALGSDPSN